MSFNLYNIDKKEFVDKISFREEFVDDYKNASIISRDDFFVSYNHKENFKFISLPDDIKVYINDSGKIILKDYDEYYSNNCGIVYNSNNNKFLKINLDLSYTKNLSNSTNIVGFMYNNKERYCYSSQLYNELAKLKNIDRSLDCIEVYIE